jgi:hypothetical protein
LHSVQGRITWPSQPEPRPPDRGMSWSNIPPVPDSPFLPIPGSSIRSSGLITQPAWPKEQALIVTNLATKSAVLWIVIR